MTQKTSAFGAEVFYEVSCWDEIKRCHAVWETIGEKFPVGMKYHRAMSDEKLSANSFLPARNAMVSNRIGNYPQTVSCR